MARIFRRINLTPSLGFWRFRVRLEFKIQDLWIGAFWQTTHETRPMFHEEPLVTEIWICLVPMFPIHIGIWRANSMTPGWSLPV